MLVRKFIGFVCGVAVCWLFAGNAVQAQNQTKKRIIQLSGIVSDSITVVPGVHVYVPKAGRGVPTNYAGFFPYLY